MRLLVFVILSIVPFALLNADTLAEISQFAKEVCDDIKPQGNKKITKTELEGRLKGDMGRIAKFIGAQVGVDGKLTYGDTDEQYSGLPIGSLAAQMSDSRACKKEISKMLLGERKKILSSSQKTSQEKKTNKQTGHVKQSNGYEVALKKHSFDNGVLTMDFSVKSLEKTNKLFVFISHGGRRTKLVDDEGKMHFVTRAGIGGGQTRNMFSANTLYQNVPMNMKLTFHGLSKNVKKIPVLDITFGNGTYKFGNSFSMVFNDLEL